MWHTEPLGNLHLSKTSIATIKHPIIKIEIEIFRNARSFPGDDFQWCAAFGVLGHVCTDVISVTCPRVAVVPQLGRYPLLEHQSVPPFLEFMNSMLGRILVWPSRSGDMVFHFASSNSIHETSLGSGLNWCTVESELFRDAIIVNKLCQRIAHIVAVNLLQLVACLESAIVGVQFRTNLATEWLHLVNEVSVTNLPLSRLTENIRSALYCQLIGRIADRTAPLCVVTQRVHCARGRLLPNLSANTSAVTFRCR